jgi:hypothetical protein
MLVDGGDEQRVGDGCGAYAVVADDVSSVAGFGSQNPVTRFSNLSDGQLSTIAKLSKPIGDGMTVSPDGYLLYTQKDEERRERMLVENFRYRQISERWSEAHLSGSRKSAREGRASRLVTQDFRESQIELVKTARRTCTGLLPSPSQLAEAQLSQVLQHRIPLCA